jgi:lysophospholipase
LVVLPNREAPSLRTEQDLFASWKNYDYLPSETRSKFSSQAALEPSLLFIQIALAPEVPVRGVTVYTLSVKACLQADRQLAATNLNQGPPSAGGISLLTALLQRVNKIKKNFPICGSALPRYENNRSLKMKTLTLAVLTALVCASQAFAIPEANLTEGMATEVMPFYEQGVLGTFTGEAGVPISYIKFENPNEIGAVVIVSGRTETYALYAETIYDLAQKGYSVYAYDHRGQGFSGRMLPDAGKGYVAHFQDYVADLKTFMDMVVNTKPHRKHYLLAHSMGGAVSALFEDYFPGYFDAFAMSSPMFEINTSPYPQLIARLIINWNLMMGKAEEYGTNQTPYNPSTPFETNDATSSEARWMIRQAVFNGNPVTQLGGPTNRWIKEAMKGSHRAFTHAESFHSPLLIFRAGADTVVIPAAEEQFCSKAPDCEITAPYPEAKHELLRERDEVRDDVYGRMFKFFAEH